MLGVAKGFASFPAPWNLQVSQLNAPFGADWNDYPHTEKLIYYAWGALLHFFSAGVAANIMLLI
ncbi:MAG TPA: hypothetical protein VFV94_00730, partial [Polyangiaceae bacterium]|nr:hypothetical protein [Polyangiaceae bacterium]